MIQEKKGAKYKNIIPFTAKKKTHTTAIAAKIRVTQK